MTISNLAIGKAGELRVASELLLRGFLPMMTLVDKGTDIILETGERIQVKAAHQIRKDSTHNIYVFSFTTGWNQVVRETFDFDFVVLWAIDKDAFFVIPRDQLIGLRFVRLNVSDEPPRGKSAKWHAFRDAWSLIS